MIIIHAADIHLGSALGGLDQHEGLPTERIRSAPLAAFTRIADLCEERGADVLLIAGDLFDTNAPLAVIREATAVLQRIAGAGTRVVLIRGNHDAQSKMQRRLPQIAGVHELSSTEPETLELGELSLAVHGRGFDTPRVTDNIVATYPARIAGAFNVGMLHTSFEGSSRHASYAPCQQADLVAKGYDYWALGHIHQHGILCSDPWIVFAGSPQGRHIGETGAHGVYVLEVEDGALVRRPEHVELGAVQWHRLTVAAEEETARAGDLVELAGRRLAGLVETAPDVLHVVRLQLAGRCAAHEELQREPGRWRDELAGEALAAGGAGCFLEKVAFDTGPALPPAETLRERTDFVGDLAKHLAADAIVDAERGDAGPPPDLIVALDDKLRALGAFADHLREQPVTLELNEQAREHVLGRLLAATHERAEVAG